MKRIFITFYLFLSVALWQTAFATASSEFALPPLSPAGQNLQHDLLNNIRTLDRDVQLYHYFRAPSDEADPQQINQYLQNKINRDGWLKYFFGFRMGAFWDPNNHVTEMTASGPGMYFALDPSVSREFGESAVVMNLPAGMKYLSVVKGIALSKETRELLVEEKIISEEQLNTGEKQLGLSRAFSADTLKNFVREENKAFRELVSEIFSRNQIALVEYSWKSNLAGFCKKDSQSAFVLVGLKPSADDLAANDTEVLAGLPEEVKDNFFFFSDFQVEDLGSIEVREKDLLSRFRLVLDHIKEKGASKAKKYIEQNLNDQEVAELSERTYRCERRH